MIFCKFFAPIFWDDFKNANPSSLISINFSVVNYNEFSKTLDLNPDC